MLDYVQNTLLIRIPHISKENLADEWLRINRAQPVYGKDSCTTICYAENVRFGGKFHSCRMTTFLCPRYMSFDTTKTVIRCDTYRTVSMSLFIAFVKSPTRKTLHGIYVIEDTW